MTTPRPRPAIVPPLVPGHARSARLVVFRDGVVFRAVELTARGLTIGRGLQNDLVLDDPDRTVSRFHAEVRLEAGRWESRRARGDRALQPRLRRHAAGRVTEEQWWKPRGR
jgi:hypothetical protein